MRTYWFNRFEGDLKKISKHIRLKRIKHGFYRIYFKQAYIHEVIEEMPPHGYDIEDYDPRFESQQYFEKYEDDGEFNRKIKNYVEGYWESIDKIQKRVWMMKHDNEFYEAAKKRYSMITVK